MNTSTKPSPIKIIRENVSKEEIAKYYLEIELSKLFTNIPTEKINETVNNLNESKIWALLEAVSFTYHLNAVFFKLTTEGFVWNEEEWHIKDLLMTGMDSNINKVIFSQEVNGDVLKFRDYLFKYFETHTKNDPEKLFSYKPKKQEIKYTKMLATMPQDKIAMLDGSHRLTEMLLRGYESATLYVGHPTPNEREYSKKTLVGKSTFIFLGTLYKHGSDEEKEAILTVMKQLIRNSLNGHEAVQKFWAENVYDEGVREAGKKLIGL